jgi:hypothetical protein
MGKFVLWAKRATHVCLLRFLSTFPVVYLGRNVRASACFEPQFAFSKVANLWVMVITHRLLKPLGPTGGVQ